MTTLTYCKGLPTDTLKVNALGCSELEMFGVNRFRSLSYNVSGIYCIKSLSTNKLYVGHSIDIKKRLYQHVTDIKAGRHCNKYLVSHSRKYGINDFVYAVLEIIPISEILDKNYLSDVEQLWIDAFCPVFNLIPAGRSCRGMKLSPETKKKLSEAHKGKKHSQIHKDNGAFSRAKEFTIISPDGNIVSGINIAAFCRENNLDQGAICSVLRGESFSYKKWTKDLDNYERLVKCGTIKAKTSGKLIHKDGSVHEVFNQSDFARRHSLNPSHVSAVLSGKLKQTKGFRLYTEGGSSNWSFLANPEVMT